MIWTLLMAVGIFAAFRGIGGDCVGLLGSELSECQTDAWARGGIGLLLLLVLWVVVAAPVAIARFLSRPRVPTLRE